MEKIPELTNISSLHGYLECTETFDLDPQPLLKECNIDFQMLTRQEGFISTIQLSNILALSAEKTRCPHFALLLSQSHNLNILGLLGLMLERDQNLRSALEDSIRYLRIHTQGGMIELEETGELALIKYQMLIDLPSAIHNVDLAIGTIVNSLSINTVKIRSVYLTRPTPKDTDIYRQILGTKVIFNHEFNAIVLDRKQLDMPLEAHDKVLQQVLLRNVEKAEKEIGADFVSSTRNMINSLLPFGQCSLELVAKHLTTSSRTLQYRLSKQNTTFKQLTDEVRIDIAQRQLSSHTSISQLGEMLGYSDQTAFSRAFKRWFGVSPKKWKKANTSSS